MTLRSDLLSLGITLPSPSKDRGGQLACALLTVANRSIRLSHDTAATAILTLAHAAGLLIPADTVDLSGCLQTAVDVRLAQESPDPDGQVLAAFYASLWALLEQAGTPVPAEETDQANEELADTGWMVTKQGGSWHAIPNGADGGGVQLAHHGAFGRQKVHTMVKKGEPDTWVRFRGPHGGLGWKHTTTGVVRYGGAMPTDKTVDVYKREEHARQLQRKGEQGRKEDINVTKPAGMDSQAGGLASHETRSSMKAFAVLHKNHGDMVLHRLDTLSRLTSGALGKVPGSQTELRGMLWKQLMAIKTMTDQARKQGEAGKGTVQGGTPDSPGGQGGMSAAIPGKPQSPFLPKRGTS